MWGKGACSEVSAGAQDVLGRRGGSGGCGDGCLLFGLSAALCQGLPLCMNTDACVCWREPQNWNHALPLLHVVALMGS